MGTDNNMGDSGVNAPLTTGSLSLRIPQNHPALPGHFPGQPIVPGVVLLDRVLDAAEKWLGRSIRLRTLKQVKFVAPLLPEQDARIELELQGEELRFAVTRNGEAIAQGLMSIDAEVRA